MSTEPGEISLSASLPETESKQASDLFSPQSVQMQQLAFEMFMDEAPTGFVLCNRDLQLMKVNRALAGMVGLSAHSQQDYMGKAISVLFPEQEAQVVQTLKQVIEHGIPVLKQFLDCRNVSDPGRQRVKLLSYYPLWQQQEVIGVGIICEEVVGEKQCTSEANRIRAELSAIVSSSDDAIIGKTLEGIITSWNKGAEWLYGYTAEEVIGLPISFLIPASQPDELPVILERLKQGQRIEHYETSRLRKDASIIDVSVTISPIRDEHGTIIGASVIARNISTSKEIERKKDEFISLASHELRTPITALKLYIQQLYKKYTREELVEIATELARADLLIDRLTKLVKNLLDVSRANVGKIEYKDEHFSLDELVVMVVDTQQAMISSHRLQIECQESVSIYGDRERIQHVLTHLLSNAVKYSPGGKRIVIRLEKVLHHAYVSVQDFGIGIEPALHEKIFKRFYQVTDERNPSFAGLGLGLYLASIIIQRHNGRIWVESQKGTGSIFHFSLPLGPGYIAGS